MAKPPWTLTGNGYIFVFKFPHAFVEAHGFIPDHLEGKYHGGLGTVMLVDYLTSPVGPYREALFVPGLFNYAGHRLYSITKIFVSSIESVLDGQDNWGIPKELARFNITPVSDAIDRFTMSQDQRVLLDVTLRTRGPQIPLNTRWSPVKPRLIQHFAGRDLITQPAGKGRMSLAHIEDICVNQAGFPDFSDIRPLAGFYAQDFTLKFPIPQLVKDGSAQ